MSSVPSLLDPPPIDSSLDQTDPGLGLESAPAAALPPTEPAPTPEISPAPPKNSDDASYENKPQSNAESAAPPEAISAARPVDDTIAFNLQLIDFAGDPIAGLKYRIIVGKTEYEGTTDEKGNGQEITGLKPLEPLEILVRKSNGDYSSKYKGFTECADMNVCGVSPHIKVPVTTDRHESEPTQPPMPDQAPGPAPAQEAAAVPAPATPPEPVPAKPAPAAKTTPPAPPAPTAPGKGQIESGGKGMNKDTTECRNSNGNPTATLKERAVDWAKRNRIPTFGIWNWDDFVPKAKGCTAPAIGDTESKPPPPTGQDSPKEKQKPPTTQASSGGNQTPAIKVSNANQSAPKKVTDLIATMEEQTHWEWKKIFEEDKFMSATIATGLLKKTFQPRTGKPIDRSDGRCYPAVKIGLWRNAIVSGFNNDIPAKGAGPWLESQGFKNITKSIPDARWALPGDIIVYRYPDAKEEANSKKAESAMKKYAVVKAEYDLRKASFDKEVKSWEADIARRKLEKEDAKRNKKKYSGGLDPKKPSLGPEPNVPDDGNYGHIDVRSYDGYLSDFKKTSLQLTQKFLVIGIYRKIFDPVPEIRVRAFLKILREWECHSEHDDSKRYYMLPGVGKFTDTTKHPFEGKSSGSTPSGAYQITLQTYNDFLNRGFGLQPGFTPAHQDRMAVAILEHKVSRSALAQIRLGNIEAAVDIARLTWSSLPGGVHCRHDGPRYYTMSDVMERYNIFVNELLSK